MSTYSINIGTPYESTFKGDLDRDFILNPIPNNTSQLVVPKSVRDSLFTIWDNISFKIVAATGSSYSYIGIGGQNHESYYSNDGLPILLGKPSYNGSDIMNNYLLEYDENNALHSNSDVYVYNSKPDSFDGGSAHKQYTKMSFLSGDNSNNLLRNAPYILSQQNVGGTAIDMTIYNEAGKVIIDSIDELQIGSPNTKITLLYATGSTGIKTLPSGNIGDLQTNLDDCEFGNIDGQSANLGDVLIMGASNSPYWGNISLNFIGTLNQTLSSGNTSDGEDMILTENDTLYIGGTSTNHSYITHNSSYTNFKTDNGEIRIGANIFRLDIDGIGPNKTLYTDSNGFVYWGTSFTNTGSFKPMSNDIIINDTNLTSLDGGYFYKLDSGTNSIKINLDVNPSLPAGQEWEFFAKNLDNTSYFDSNVSIISEDNYIAFSKKGSFIKVRYLGNNEFALFGSHLDLLSIGNNENISISGENDLPLVFTGNTGDTATIEVNSVNFVIGDIGGQFVFDIGGSQSYTYTSVNETNQFVANGLYFDITWGGTGSQYFNYSKQPFPTLTDFSSSIATDIEENVCGLTISETYYHDGGGSLPNVNDFVYSEDEEAVDGYMKLQAAFYKLSNDYYITVNSNGMVTNYTQCTPDLTSVNMYTSQNGTNEGFTDPNEACISEPTQRYVKQVYHDSNQNVPQIGDTIYEDSNGQTTFSPNVINQYFILEVDDGGGGTMDYAFSTDNSGVISDIQPCQ